MKLYQGVTLGALSTRKGQQLSGVKRHPTIEDNVTIYSNSSVLGGETVIGENTIIGGNTFINRINSCKLQGKCEESGAGDQEAAYTCGSLQCMGLGKLTE